MAINRNNFIFHSDYLPFPISKKFNSSITVSGSLTSGQRRTYYGPWEKVNSKSILPTALWKVPNVAGWRSSGGTGRAGVWSEGRFIVNQQGTQGQQPMGIWAFPYVEAKDGQVRAAIQLFNNQSSTLTIPTATFDFRVTAFVVPNRP